MGGERRGGRGGGPVVSLFHEGKRLFACSVLRGRGRRERKKRGVGAARVYSIRSIHSSSSQRKGKEEGRGAQKPDFSSFLTFSCLPMSRKVGREEGGKKGG